MSSILTVLTKPAPTAGTFDIYWACGRHVQGVVTVTVACKIESPAVAAELVALKHLLEEREVCGTDRTGKSLRLVCSFGAVRKLARGESDHATLAPFALFLRTRFADAEVTTSKDEAFISHTKAHNHVARLVVDAPTASVLAMSDGLRVGVTRHALDAYRVRYQNLVASSAWRALRAAMANPGTRLQHCTPEEASRHGKTIRAYTTPDGLRLIVVVDGSGARLLTCYYSDSAALARR